MDHLLAAIHAKVDVEVGHRYPLGVQEPLKQQRISQWIKVGDRQRISHERPRARPPARPHGDALIFAPLDKVGNDQEIARKAHALDDAQLKVEPRLVFLKRGGMGDHREPLLQALIGHPAQFGDLIIGKLGQDRVTLVGFEGTPLGDLQSVFDRLRQVRKQGDHLGLRFEIMLRG